MGAGKADTTIHSMAADELTRVLPEGSWYKRGHMIKLNFCIISLVLFCKYWSLPKDSTILT